VALLKRGIKKLILLLIIGGVIFILLFLVLIFALLKAASMADRQEEKIYERMNREDLDNDGNQS
jgi:choline-glycine betaine transporter